MAPPIIDTHLHVWDFNYAKYEWLEGNDTILNRNYFIEELTEREQAGVTGAVLVQAANNLQDTDRMLELATETPWVLGVVGWLPLENPQATAEALENRYLVNKYFKGVRHLINDEPDESWLLQDTVIESLGILAAHNLPYDLVGISNGHIRTALAVAEKVPGLKMVFDHLNQPPIQTKQFGDWGALMLEAARNKNFYAKISGLGTASRMGEEWTAADLSPYIEFAINNFGEDRCFCGGDWPVCLLAGSYSKHWQTYNTVLRNFLDERSVNKVLAGNAAAFYSLGEAAYI